MWSSKKIVALAVFSLLLASPGSWAAVRDAADDISVFNGGSNARHRSIRVRFERAEYESDEVIVKFKGRERFQRVRVLGGEDVQQTVEHLRRRRDVEYAEPNFLAHALMVPSDPYFRLQWNLSGPSGSIKTPVAWDVSAGAGVTVAVLDTGVAYETSGVYVRAPDLATTCFVPGYDFVSNDTHPNDDNSHGTHVAGTIAQSTNNSRGVAGVAFRSCLMPVKVLDRNGVGTYADIADGIRWAADQGAQVINLSLGGPVPAASLEEALAYAVGKGVTIVAAAGNDGSKTLAYPAAYNAYVIAVGATRYDERLVSYSNRGSGLDVVAPGGDLAVDQNGDGYRDGVLQNTFNPNTQNPSSFGYWFFQGTSMATPHVAGLAALVIARGAATTPDAVRAAIQTTAKDLGTSGWDETYGWGLVDAAAAVAYTPTPVDAPPTITLDLPTTGAVVAGTVAFAAAAGDDVGLVRVDFAVDGSLVGSDAAAPYQWSWDSATVADGDHTVMATAVDTASQTTSASATVTVDNVNQPPVAAAGPDQTVADPDGDGVATVTLSGAGSTDPDGVITSYAWTESGTPLGAAVTLTYPFPLGSHTITLTVTDDRGGSASDAVVVIVVANQPPLANAGPDQTGAVGTLVTFSAAGSSDPDGSLVSYAWDFGDGSTGSGVTVSHAFATVGLFTTTLTVADNGGLTATDTATATVTEVPLTVVAFADSFEVGEWNRLWTEDSQNDWFRSSQRATDGSWSAEVDGYASNAKLMSIPVNLQGKTNATINFSWYIESALDNGEYIAFDVSLNGGASWVEKVRLRGADGVKPQEDTWHPVSVELNGISQLRLRFRGKMTAENEDANVDNLRVTAQ